MLRITQTVSFDEKSVSDEMTGQLVSRWHELAASSSEALRLRIRRLLEASLFGAPLSDQVLTRCPFLRHKESFLRRYLACVEVQIQETGLSAAITGERLQQVGLPDTLAELLEYGASDFPAYKHWEQAVYEWQTHEGMEILKGMQAIRLKFS